jgi:hypothetical protein
MLCHLGCISPKSESKGVSEVVNIQTNSDSSVNDMYLVQ